MLGKRISFVNGTNGTNGKAELSHLYVLVGGRIKADPPTILPINQRLRPGPQTF